MSEPATLQLEFAGLSDVGRSRSRNEDSFDISPENGLCLVCDGMGGHAGGDIASRTAAETIIDFIYEYEPDANDCGDVDDVEEDPEDERTMSGSSVSEAMLGRSISTIRAAVVLANRKLISLNQERGYPEGRGMGTTVVGLWRIEGTERIILFHAGDSRLYRLRKGELRQLTRDHSLYQAWLDSGAYGQPPQRNIIVRALGTMRDVEPEVSLQSLAPGDLYLLCSDGLTTMMQDEEISGILQTGEDGDLEELCSRLIARANEKGGYDNVTVILARCVEQG